MDFNLLYSGEFKPLLMSAARITLAVIIGYTALMSAYLYLYQEKFLFIVTPITEDSLDWTRTGVVNTEEIKVKTRDGVKLHGWLVKNTRAEKTPLVIYFGGNAEEASSFVMESKRFRGWGVLSMNYRGYGLSNGTPSEKNLFNDALEIFDRVAKRDDIEETMVVAMGRSLGTGVAVHLASKRPLAGVILVSPYDSMTRVVKGMYPFLPVSLLLRHHFDSLSRAPGIKAPLLALAGTEDTLIKPERTKKLVNAWGGERTLILIDGKDHVTLEFLEIYWYSIREFLGRL